MFEFKEGQSVFAWRKTYNPSTWNIFLCRYPNKVFNIIRFVDGLASTADGYNFHSSDLSPIFTFEGQEWVWRGKKRNIKPDEVYLTEGGITNFPIRWTFPFESGVPRKILTPLKEDPMEGKAKYKVLKTITPDTIWQAGPKDCAEFQREFIRFLTWWLESDLPRDIQSILEAEPKWRDYVLEHGFIERVEEGRTYHFGQKFKHKDGYELRLCRLRNMGFLLSEEAHEALLDPIEVENVTHITQSEIDKMSHYSITLIE